MSLSATPSSERMHIGFFGRRNAGKSSVVNAVTGQSLAVVSDIKGTTTDPVSKAMELLPMGPVVIIDTPGIDDTGPLGELRIEKTKQVLCKTDVAVLVAEDILGPEEQELLALFREQGIPHLIVYNKLDTRDTPLAQQKNEIDVSALHSTNIHQLKEKIAALAPAGGPARQIAGDLVRPGDFVVLVTPIDEAAPKGRMILPQQQTIRDLLDADTTVIVVKETELRQTLENLGQKPALVITDSQAFEQVSAETPADIPLTSFSILFARYKGLLDAAVAGAAQLSHLEEGDAVLIAEGCTHHRQCNDIGQVKLPRWLHGYTGKNLAFSWCSGTEFPQDLSPYRLVIHCGSCMLNQREVESRQQRALEQHIPITNYGIAIAHMQGILARSLAMFPHLSRQLEAASL